MRVRVVDWCWRVAAVIACGHLFQAGCLDSIQRELDILWAPEANLNNLWGSKLIEWFGPGILQFW